MNGRKPSRTKRAKVMIFWKMFLKMRKALVNIGVDSCAYAIDCL